MTLKENPNKKIVDSIRQKIKENGGYCPCKIDKTVDTKCICKEFRDKMTKKESCTCHCGLYTITFED